MLNTLAEKVLSAVLGVVLLIVAAVAVYAAYEHTLALRAQITQLQQENANERAATAAALQAANSLGAALDAHAAAQATASKAATATQSRVASAVAAAPSVASTVVPESYWQAIYGSNNAQ